MDAHLKKGRLLISNIRPQVDCGRYRAKAVAGLPVRVSADIVREGTDEIAAVVRYRGPSRSRWKETPMAPSGNDRYEGRFTPDSLGVYRFTIEAYTDRFATWARDLRKRVAAGQDVDLELIEGATILSGLTRVPPKTQKKVNEVSDLLRTDRPSGAEGFEDPRVAAALDESIATLAVKYSQRTDASYSDMTLEVWVDRGRALFGAWYELFPRSTGRNGKHGTFATAIESLDRVAMMGFDIVYLPPIHPIGTTARKGRNNTLTPGKDDVGSPWAIGSSEGGHKEIHRGLGSFDDFDDFVAATRSLGMEVALDFAIQCSPDHPWVKQHPEWFHHRPDGSIRYAENPPKKYQDIYPINFDSEDRAGLWAELKSVLDLWISHGVKVFRVDNPHTKSFPFWEWVIEEIHTRHPDVLFLAEAFTRPRVMEALAKLGFTQSYTYFTWRNTKAELTEYLEELTTTGVADYFRPNFFVNTPDILHKYLQTGGPPAFKIRLVLAAFLSPSYGVYSGYELYERTPATAGSEEYLDSEKFQIKVRDWSDEDSLEPFITRINEIRDTHPALRELTNVTFHDVDKDDMMAFSKTSGNDSVLVVVNLNPVRWEEATISLRLDALGAGPEAPFKVRDLITGSVYEWTGAHQYVRLDPFGEPAHIFEVVN